MDTPYPPSYGNQPPVLNPYPPVRRSGWGAGWVVAIALLLGVAILGLLFLTASGGLLSGGRAGRQSGEWLEEIVVENNRSLNKIAIIDVEGMITSHSFDRSGRNMVDLIEDQLKMASRDRAVKAVILKVDSPGGEVMASDDISKAIIDFQQKQGRPVVAAMGGLAASGGYYISAPCRWIVANELTITGSIGVILHSFNYRELLNKVGLHPMVFKSGRYKDMLSGSKKLEEIDPAERKMIQALIDETYARFKTVVAEGRRRAAQQNQEAGQTLAPNWEEFADGRILTGKQAHELGFVDELGNFDSAVARAKQLANIQDANLVRYKEPFSLVSLLSPFGEAKPARLEIDLGIDFPKLEAGRLYFLSPTLAH